MVLIIIGIVTALLNVILWMIKDNLGNEMISLYNICFNLDGLIFPRLSVLKDAFFSIGISLIIMKFLKKGFEIYVLWTDGDPDSDPIGYLVNFIKAIVVACTFTFIYDYFVLICEDFIKDVVNGIRPLDDIESFISATLSLGIGPAVCTLIFFIAYIILQISFYLRGIEVLILRIGMPLACVGLLDNDKGVFKAYMGQFIKVFLTTIVQIVLCGLSLSLMLSTDFNSPINAFWGIACVISAITTPKLIREFLIQTGGGGNVSNTIYQTTRIASLAKSFIK